MSASLKKNTIYNMIYQVVVIIAPLITSPYLSRVMGAESVGVYSYTYSIANYFFLFSMLGVNNYGNRAIAQAKFNRKNLSETFWQIYYLQLICTAMAGTAYFFYCLFLAKGFYQRMLLCQGIYVLSAATDINWFAFGMECFKQTTIRNIAVKLLTIVLIFAFVKAPGDVVKYTLIVTCGVVVGLLVMWPLVAKNTDFQKPDIHKILYHFKPNIILFIPYLATSIYNLDRIMIGRIEGNEAVGYYNYAMNILSIPQGLSTAVCTVFMPRVSSLLKNGNRMKAIDLLDKSVQYMNVLNIALCFGLMSVAQTFIPFYLGEEYSRTARLLSILSVDIIISGMSTILRMVYLIPAEKDRTYTSSIIIGAIVNAIGNYLAIPKLGAEGACVATLVANGSILVVQVVSSWNELPYGKWLRKMLPFFLCGIAEYCVVNFFAKVNFLHGIVQIAVQITAGGIIYVLLAIAIIVLLYKENIIRDIVGKTNPIIGDKTNG